MMQLKPVVTLVAVGVTVGEGDAVGVTVAVAVAVTVGVVVDVGVGVMPFATTVNVSSALRGLVFSVARMVCCPGFQFVPTVMVTSKLPSPPARSTVLSCAASVHTAPIAGNEVVEAEKDGAETESGMAPSRVRVMLLPGMKWLPCRCNAPPGSTLPLPLKESEGASTVKAVVIMLVMIRIMALTMMSQAGAQPGGLGFGFGGGVGCVGCVGG